MYKIFSLLGAVGAVLAMMLVTAPMASAQSYAGGYARATLSLNVRSGPGTGYRVVDQLYENERVGVQRCNDGWCYIEHSGPDGWVSARYLTTDGGSGGQRPQPSGGNADFNSTAQATAALNVRSGPGTSYGVVFTLYRGENVRLGRCQSGWCLIRNNDGTGWVSERYLSRGGSGGGGASSGPDVNFSISTPNFSFSIGTGANFGNRPERPNRDGRVCFYEDFDYGGRSFCARQGESDPRLNGFWNDRISSIRIQGDIEVQVCQDFNYGGRCGVLTASQRSFEPRNNDIISSYRTR